ncbi:DUF4167 domain-containing protein [Sphingomonas sp. URHD0057]|uniref:DUF4167 domain-containing protein n=1 Tax=Sphingomonas sp. URHD0057 TaxID=1380389 RepID=UPI000491FA42|nr:DUF4167 domain-containing protein [Sphingomonas sp. URHD0057]
MINNRQGGGRRRGRGGQGSGGGGGRNLGGQPGNRQDNRQRGNAAQLLEKYKSMARDAQLAGDRVQTEYFLQFADHYFRVLGESRARFEDQNPRRQRDEEMDEDEGDEELAEAGDVEASDDRPERAERFNRRDRPHRSEGDEQRSARAQRPERASRDEPMNGEPETIPFDALPPAIGRDDQSDEVEAEPERPRRRARAARPADGDDEIAPAA